MNKIFYLLILFIFPVFVFSQNEEYSVMRYDVTNGLPSSNISCIFQDHIGLMWLGTQNGLVKYDGNNFTIYKNNQNNKHSFINNMITSIYESKYGNLFVGTREGLYLYNKRNDSFDLVLDQTNSLNETTIIANITAGNADTVYVLASNRNDLYKCVYNDSKKKCDIQVTHLSNIKNNNFLRIIVDKQNRIWISSFRNILQLNNGKISFFEFNKTQSEVLIKSMTESPNGSIILATNKGLFSVNELIHTIEPSIYNNSQIQDLNLIDFRFDSQQLRYVATDNDGIFVFNKSGSIKQHLHKSNIEKISNNSILSIFIDSNGNIWSGILGNGLVVFYLNKIYYEKYYLLQNSGLKSNIINIATQIDQNTLLVGTDGSGLKSINLKNNTITNIQSPELESDKIINICKYSNTQYFIGMYGGGASLYDSESNHFEKIPLLKNNQKIKNAYSFLEYSKDTILIATMGQGLIAYNPKSKTTKSIDSVIWNGTPFALNKFSNIIKKDKEGRIWICTMGDGIYLFDPKLKMIDHYNSWIPNRTISNSVITSLSFDKNSNAWVGTYNGLNIINPRTKKVRTISTKDGLISSNINYIQCNQNYSWIGTIEGLSKIDNITFKIQNFQFYDGIWTANPSCNFVDLLYNGKILVGGLKGLMIFDKDSIQNRFIDLHFNILSCKVNDSIYLTVKAKSTVSLPYDQNSISLEFASLHYAFTSHINYQYSITKNGIDNWIDLKNKHSLNLVNLSNGRYDVKLKAYINDKSDQASIIQFTLIIEPPFWKTWWFTTLLILCFSALILIIFSYRIRRIKLVNAQLELKVEKRTIELATSKMEIEKHLSLVKTQNDELRKMNDTQQQIFNILAHDLKNPLIGIANISEVLHSNIISFSPVKSKEYVKEIGSSVFSITKVIDDMLGWIKSRSSGFTPKIEVLCVNDIIDDCIITHALFAQNRNVKLYVTSSPLFYVNADKAMAAIIFRNLINNAIKFSPIGSDVSITISANSEYIKVSVIDSAEKLKEQQIKELLYTSNTQSTADVKGIASTGLGISICKEFAKTLQGFLQIEDLETKGNSFSINLPKAKTIPQQVKTDILTKDLEGNPIQINWEILNDKTILIVDDEPSFILMYTNLFANKATLLIAKNGKEAITIANEQLPDLIISDVMMPGVSGIEMCSTLKNNKLTCHIPIILLTANNDDLLQLTGLESKADDFLFKPFNRNILLLKISNYFESRKILQAKAILDSNNKTSKTDSFDDIFIKTVLDYINKNLNDTDLNVEILSEEFGFSRSQFFRKIKALMGYSPIELIKIIRLKKAADLLANKKLSISEICYETGFSQPSYFSKCFKEYFKLTPTEYIENTLK